jgi:membrane protein required for colicin V production
MSMTDWALWAVLLLSMLMGVWRGLVREMLSLAGWVAAFFLAQWLAAAVAVHLPLQSAAPSVQYAGGFLIVFVGVIFLSALLAWLLGHLMGAVGLRPADRALGALFGLARGTVLLMALAVLVRLTGMAVQAWWRESMLVPWLQLMLDGLRPVLPQAWQAYIASIQ